MSSRTRSRDDRVSAKVRQTHNWTLGTTVPGPSGSQTCLPMMLKTPPSWVSTNTSAFGVKSVITDENTKGFGCKNVDHSKTVTGEYSVVPYWSRGSNGLGLRTRYASADMVYVPSEFYLDQRPLESAYNTFATRGYVAAPNEDSTLTGEPTNDRLGEIPARLCGKLQDLSLMITAYESREIPGLVRQIAGRESIAKHAGELVRMLKSVTNGRERTRLFLKLMSEFQLTWAFGINPTVKDVKQICQEVAKPHRFRKTVVASVIDRYSLPIKSDEYNDPLFGKQSVQLTQESMRVWGGVCEVKKDYAKYGSLESLAKFIDQYLGANPMASIWAVMPWSFCIDWVFGIDNVLDNYFLNNNPDYKVEYWSSRKVTKRAIYRSEYPVDFESVKVPYLTSYASALIKYTMATAECERSYSRYQRSRRDPPSLLSSVKLFGRMNAKTSYLSVLLASGLVSRSSIVKTLARRG